MRHERDAPALKGKDAVVTGGANGIGLGICRALAKAGVDLHAIRHDEFFVFTHPETRQWIEARHRRIMAGFDQLDRYLARENAASAPPRASGGS